MKMNLKQFKHEMLDDFDRFEKFWLENQKTNKEHFPEEMGDGDWFDQFMSFISSFSE